MSAKYFLNSGISSVVSLDLNTSWAAKSLDSALYFRDKISQAKFQQKQLEEKEQKLLALYEEQAHQAYQRVGQGGGKVRQLFQERRTNHQPGFDRSYPLEPIYDNRRESRGASLDRSQNTGWKNQTSRRSKSQVRKQPDQFEENYPHIPKNNNNFEERQVLDNSFTNQTILFGDENDYLTKATNDLDSSRVFKKLPNIGATTLSQAFENRVKKDSVVNKVVDHQNNMSPAKEPVLKKTVVQSKVNDVASLTKSISKMSTTTTARKIEAKSSTTASSTTRVKTVVSTPLSNSKRTTPSPTSSIGSSRPASNTAIKESPSTTPKTMKPAAKGPRAIPGSQRPASGTTSGLASCKTCSRNFAPDRVKAHEVICSKTAKKKRKVFDPVKQRLKGTEAEPYLRKGKPPPPPPLSKSNWRRKHEDFIANIRAAKVAQAHVAKGGKLSDLPPPPPMDTSDLIPCPHCGRKFNDGAAARHIPKCATMLHNKPKPTVGKPSTVKRR